MKLYLVTLTSMIAERDREVHVVAENFGEAAAIAKKERYAGEYPSEIKLMDKTLWVSPKLNPTSDEGLKKVVKADGGPGIQGCYAVEEET